MYVRQRGSTIKQYDWKAGGQGGAVRSHHLMRADLLKQVMLNEDIKNKKKVLLSLLRRSDKIKKIPITMYSSVEYITVQ